MENPNGPDPNENNDAPDASPQQSGARKRRRIGYTPTQIMLSSDQLKAEEPIKNLETDLTEEDYTRLTDPETDLFESEDELLVNEEYIDDLDSEEDPLNEPSGRRAGSEFDLELDETELDHAGSSLDTEEDDFFGFMNDGEGALDDDEFNP